MKKVPVLDIKQFHVHDGAEDFYANTLENHLVTRHKDISHPHSHNFYVAVLFTHGSGIHEIDFKSYAITAGALFFLNPGQTHHWELSPDTKGFIFLHTRPFYEMHYTHNNLGQFPFFYSLYNVPCLYLGNNETDSITTLFKQIYTENQKHDAQQHNILLSLVNLVYSQSARLYFSDKQVTGTDNNYYTKFRKFEDLAATYFREEKSPAYYAGLLAVSPRHLNRIAQAVTGKTATDVILDRVMLEAKKELVLQQDSFANIAEGLGYDDYAYFSRLFKNRTGETASHFLNRYRKA
ncbi:hypothetical protein AM493_02500 [Flavobacterium akiainvivens]|uniref:HTH araC/xylS-type domain-containing protein n=1 Tax=Flavobacterium akiainvivens TaxID=1202724 RepID=A0A0N0RQE2_9FLAO|nr:helix-turn-helix domain-containing protein [Flavobacterium akiainvivens]KOS05030.1 hypothetical protein AM493_02500 [Flavobacterium akiainvivens]SFQ40016.1 AraC-type DNA-binding protein [Flavobacterium akiainvivens]